MAWGGAEVLDDANAEIIDHSAAKGSKRRPLALMQKQSEHGESAALRAYVRACVTL